MEVLWNESWGDVKLRKWIFCGVVLRMFLDETLETEGFGLYMVDINFLLLNVTKCGLIPTNLLISAKFMVCATS